MEEGGGRMVEVLKGREDVGGEEHSELFEALPQVDGADINEKVDLDLLQRRVSTLACGSAF